MARKKLKPCCKTGCRNTTRERFCEKHRGETWNSWQQGQGNRHERGYGKEWGILRECVKQQQGGLCQPCLAKGIYTPMDEVDHIIPKSQGGTDDITNLQCICKSCHARKTATERRQG